MTTTEAIRHLLRTTDWNIAGIAFVLGVRVGDVLRVAKGEVNDRY